MGKKLLVGNLKMYMTKSDIDNYLNTIVGRINNDSVVLIPTSIYLPYFLNRDFSVGIQNIATTEKGAYTGEVSALQASSLGVQYTIVGHSERREFYNETSEEIYEKIKNAIKNNIIPIVCIGETLKDYENKKTTDFLKQQIIDSFTGLTSDELEKIIIAYEPIWAIGTGKVPTNEEIRVVVRMIKTQMSDLFHINKTLVLYGGSVSEKNIEQLEKINNLDGYLVGSAATKALEILKMEEVVYRK